MQQGHTMLTEVMPRGMPSGFCKKMYLCTCNWIWALAMLSAACVGHMQTSSQSCLLLEGSHTGSQGSEKLQYLMEALLQAHAMWYTSGTYWTVIIH